MLAHMHTYMHTCVLKHAPTHACSLSTHIYILMTYDLRRGGKCYSVKHCGNLISKTLITEHLNVKLRTK